MSASHARPLPRPPVTTRERTQLEAFLVLRRNPLELWGNRAYDLEVIPGKFLGRRQLLLNDPEAIRHVLVTNSENYGRAIAARRILRPVIGAGLFLAQGESWRHQRRTMAPAFAPRTMPILARHVVQACEHTETMLTAMAGRPIELLPRFQGLALAIAGRSMFSLETAGFATAMRAMLMRYARTYAKVGLFDLLLPITATSPLDRGRAAFRAEWLGLMDQILRERRQRPPSPDEPRDLFDLMDSARDPETGAGFDHAQLRDEFATLILAGHETTSVTLFWAVFIAASLPEQQENLAREVADIDLSADNAAAALRRLPAIRAHIDETLRLYPPAFLLTRQALGADNVAGHEVTPGTVISIAPWVLHRHRKLWTNPEGFDPGRFMPGAPAPDRHAYMPFGAGPRICIGAQFALTEAVLVLARLLQKFRVELVGGASVQPRGLVTTQPDRPVSFVLRPRLPG